MIPRCVSEYKQISSLVEVQPGGGEGLRHPAVASTGFLGIIFAQSLSTLMIDNDEIETTFNFACMPVGGHFRIFAERCCSRYGGLAEGGSGAQFQADSDREYPGLS